MNRSTLLAIALIPAITIAAEPEATMSFQGYSGLINTPTATLFDEGKFYLQLGNQVETRDGYRSGESYNFGLGLWEYVEVSGRLAEYWYPGTGVSSPRDLSANVKLKIPLIPNNWFRLSAGIQDLGGAANYFDSQYIVASKQMFSDVDISLGLGRSDSSQGRLSGVFGGVTWQPYEWAKLSAEYDATDTQLALHLSTPKGWHNSGTQLTTNLLISSTNEDLKDTMYYGVGLIIPLGLKKGTNTSKSRNNKYASVLQEESSNRSRLNNIALSSTDELRQIKSLLVEEGFESVKVAEIDKNTMYVELENHIYNRNQIDGLGIVMGIISKHLNNYSYFKLVLVERDTPILVIKGSLDEYDAFLRDNKPLKLDISTETFNEQEDNIKAELQEDNHSWFKPRLTFWPGVISRVGTEFGTIDASVALVSHLELPLWPGAVMTAKHTTQVLESNDFEDGEFYSDYKHKTGVQDFSFHQTFSLPHSVKNMTFGGRYRDTYNYLANEIRWQSFAGSHKFNLLTARYENQVIPERDHYDGCNILFASCWKKPPPQEREVIVAKYRYYNAQLEASAEIQIGQYWQQDKGVVVKLERMFGDVTLNLTYKDSKVKNEEANQFIGLGFSVPLTPRKDFNNKYFQVRGKPKWAYSVNTLVGKNHNTLTPGSGDSTQLFYNLDSAFYNNNRLGSEYIYGNQSRLREVYYQSR